MRKSLILLIAALALLGSGCSKPVTPPTVKNDDSVNQVFEQKKQCEPYLLAYRTEKENETLPYARGPERPYMTRVRGCFSKKFNSCVGLAYNAYMFEGDSGDEIYELRDLVTRNLLYFSRGQMPPNQYFMEAISKFRDDVNSIECSDGQMLYVGAIPL